MLTNNELLKLFVRVPAPAQGEEASYSFDGAAVSGANGEKRLFFEEYTGKIWAKGVAYGGSGSAGLTQQEVQSLINNTLNLTDDNNVIDKISEVINWFNNLPEGDAGAVALINLVGKPSVTAQPAVYSAVESGTTLTAEQTYYTSNTGEGEFTAQGNEVSDGTNYFTLTTPAVTAQAATGLYALVEQNTTDIAQNASDIDDIEAEIGHKAIKYTQAEANTANAGLTGALNSTDELTAEQATAYNTAVNGASKSAGDTLSTAEANAYNATLDGAKSTDDVKTPSTGIYKYVDDVIEENEEVTAAALTDLNTRVSTLEDFDPWEDYVAPANSGE